MTKTKSHNELNEVHEFPWPSRHSTRPWIVHITLQRDHNNIPNPSNAHVFLHCNDYDNENFIVIVCLDLKIAATLTIRPTNGLMEKQGGKGVKPILQPR